MNWNTDHTSWVKHLAYKAGSDWIAACMVVRDGRPSRMFRDIELIPFGARNSLFTRTWSGT
jgi:hypothetical protein